MTIDNDNKQFKDVLDIIRFTNNSIFLTGKAGTGKSTLLKYICEETKKEHVVLAPTGIAAINVGGATLHSFFKLPFHPLTPDDPKYNTTTKLRGFLKYSKQHVKLIKSLDLVIIDEISMVRADIIDFIDRILRVYSGNMRVPFGGKQMLFVGDVFQLEPVVTRDERDIINRFYQSPYFFSANVFRQMPLVSVELTKVYRQDDHAFISILDHIRTNKVTNADLQLLNMRVDDTINSDDNTDPADEFTITLATRRDVVDSINQRNLDSLPQEKHVFHGEINGDFPDNSLPTSMELELKVGAQIIFIKNDQDKQWVNGTIGVIEGFSDDGEFMYIINDEGTLLNVERVQWENVRYVYNEKEKKVEEELLGTFIQFPVKLAWAITIHKSQGLTFNKVNIDLTGGAFAGGQTYVSLSRCRSLDGIKLKKDVTRADVFVNPSVSKFAHTFNDNMAFKTALKMAEADIEYKDAVEAYDKGDMDASLNHFFKAIHLRYDIEKPLVRRFLRKKLDVVNAKERNIGQLKYRIEQMRKEMDRKDSQLAELSKEYVQMAEECVKIDSLDAAIANYDKAIKLNPMYADAYVGKAKVQLSQGQSRKGLTTVNKGLAISPSLFKGLYWKAKIYYNMQKLEEAISLLDRCTSIKPNNPSAHQLLGDVLSAAGDDDNAAIHYAIAERLRKINNKCN